jgi:hypothetical protein
MSERPARLVVASAPPTSPEASAEENVDQAVLDGEMDELG